MTTYSDYSATPSENTGSPPVGAPEGNYAGDAVNDTFRDLMSVIRQLGDAVPKLGDGMAVSTKIGTLATQDSDDVSITGGSITGIDFTGDFQTTDTSIAEVKARSSRTDLSTIAKFVGYQLNDNSEYVELGGVAVVPTSRVDGDEGAQVEIQTTRDGTQFKVIAKFKDGVQVGSPTGGDKGTGTLNAAELYRQGQPVAWLDSSTELDLDWIPTMGAASAGSGGTKGLVPAPSAGEEGDFLRGDGTWQTRPSFDESANQTIDSNNDSAAISKPFTTIYLVQAWLKRTASGTALGYAQNEYAQPVAWQTTADSDDGFTVWQSSTQVGAAWRGGIKLIAKDGSSGPTAITNGDWRIVFRTWGV